MRIQIQAIEMAGLPGVPRAVRPIRTRVRGLHRGFGGPESPTGGLCDIQATLQARSADENGRGGVCTPHALSNSV